VSAAVQIHEITDSPGASRPSRLAPFSSRLLVPLLASIFAVLVIAGLHFASSMLVPIAIAIMLTLLLGPLVRGMRHYGVAEPVAAGIIVFGTITLLGVTVVLLSAPATEWLRRAPETLRQVQGKLRDIGPVKAIQETATSMAQVTAGTSADAVDQRIHVTTSSPLQRVGWTTANVVGGVLTVVFLTFFMLASGSMFRRKIAYLFPSGAHRTRIKRALYEIEAQMSRYLLINTLISVAFGVATAAFLAVIGVPNPVLWGAIAGVLNYIPYLGAFVTVVLIGIVSLATDRGTELMLLSCGGFLMLDLLKGHLVTPWVLGRRVPLNTVAVFLSLLFWGWVWGIPGVIMAVPLTVMIQVICSHSERFRGVAIVLGNWGAQRIP
jgi:predicted PurR-regulated permease PerM